MGWQLKVDRDQCRASGLCTAMAPSLLVSDNNNRPHLREDQVNILLGDVPEEISDAVECCPTGALTIVENEESGNL